MVAVTVNSFITCYCGTSTATSTADDDIGQVTVGSFANPATPPTPLTNNPAAVSTYTNFTSLGPININAGIATPITVTQFNSGFTYYQTYVKAWIDVDHSGTFEPGELVLSGSTTANNPITPAVSGTFTLNPVTSLTGLTRMRVVLVESGSAATVQPCGSYTWGETEDYTVNIVLPTPCSGQPVAGTASATPNPVCPNIPFTLSAVGATNGLNITYRWQSAPSATGPWTNIAAATNPSYTVTTGITTPTFYRFLDTCANSNLSAISNVVSVTLNSFLTCYCGNSNATSTVDDDIGQVTVGTFANPATPPSPQDYNPAANATYTNFTSLGPIVVNAGVTTPITITQFNSGFYYGCYMKAWIDADHSGTFEPSELVVGGASVSGTPATPTVSGTFNLNPLTTLAGITRMRVVLVESGSAASVQPCGTYTWGETEDYNVNIIAPPTVTTNTPVCSGGTITITASSPLPNPSFTLTGPGIATMTNTTGTFTIPNATTANSGNYNITVTTGTFTSAPRTFTVIVNTPTPVSAGTITPPTLCGGSNGSVVVNGLGNNTSYTLTFTRNNITQPTQNITADGGGSFTLTGLSSATYSNIVFTTTAGCITSPLGPLVVPSPSQPAAPQATYNAPLCPGSTLVLTVNPVVSGGIYTWTGPTSFSANGSVVTRANLTAADAGNYNVTLTTPDNCVSAVTTVNVVVNTPPAAPGVATIVYCQFEIAQPLTATGTNLKWYLTAVGGTGTNIAPTPSTLNPGDQFYFVSQTNQFGCEGPRALVTVTIKLKPQPPVVNTPLQLCQYEIAGPLTATGSSLKWYATATSVNPLPGAPTPVTNNPGTFNNYVSQTVNGCQSDRAQLVVIVKPKPAPPTVQSPYNICQGDPSAPLPVVGQNLQWYTTPTGGVGSPVDPTPPTGFEDSFTYYVAQVVNGCESDRALLKIIVNYKPNGLIIASKDFVCEGDTISFNYFGNARPDAQFNWKTPNPGTVIESGAGTQGPLVVRYNTPGNSYVRLLVNNNGCLSNELELAVPVRPQARVDINLKPDACVGESVTLGLGAVSPGVDYYNWNFDGADVKYSIGSAGPYGLVYGTPGTKVIQLFATRNGCTNFQAYTDTINVHDYPLARIIDRDYGKICAGDPINFEAEAGYDFAFGAQIPYSYSWRPVAYFGSDSGSQSNTATARLNTTTPVSVTVTNAWGCAATDSQLVTVGACCDMAFPDAFTPNGDGRNDVFRPITAGNQNVVTFRIVNRWGNVVYETTATGNGWNGLYHGVLQPMDSYAFYIKFQCNTGEFVEKQGQFMLIR